MTNEINAARELLQLDTLRLLIGVSLLMLMAFVIMIIALTRIATANNKAINEGSKATTTANEATTAANEATTKANETMMGLIASNERKDERFSGIFLTFQGTLESNTKVITSVVESLHQAAEAKDSLAQALNKDITDRMTRDANTIVALSKIETGVTTIVTTLAEVKALLQVKPDLISVEDFSTMQQTLGRMEQMLKDQLRVQPPTPQLESLNEPNGSEQGAAL